MVFYLDINKPEVNKEAVVNIEIKTDEETIEKKDESTEGVEKEVRIGRFFLKLQIINFLPLSHPLTTSSLPLLPFPKLSIYFSSPSLKFPFL